MKELPDDELVRLATTAPEGDLRAFDHLARRHRSSIVTNCRYMSRSEIDAEDLAQEVFLKAFFGLRRFEGRAVFRTWLQRIKVNHCLDHLKRQEGKSFVDVDAPEHAGEESLRVDARAEVRLEAQDERLRIDAILDGMSDTLRLPLIMRDMDQMTYQEIADTLAIGLSAVKMRIKRARGEFRERYEARPADGVPAAEVP